MARRTTRKPLTAMKDLERMRRRVQYPAPSVRRRLLAGNGLQDPVQLALERGPVGGAYDGALGADLAVPGVQDGGPGDARIVGAGEVHRRVVDEDVDADLDGLGDL